MAKAVASSGDASRLDDARPEDADAVDDRGVDEHTDLDAAHDEASHSEALEPPHSDELPQRAHRRRRRRTRFWPILTISLVLLLAAAGYVIWYLWGTTEQWHQRADDLTAVNYELGQELSDTQARLSVLEGDLDLLGEQLATSNQRLLDVAAENASIIDDQAYASQQLASLADRLSSAGSVAIQLNRCIEEQRRLADYLANAEDYDPDELADYRTSVDELCEPAVSANARLQEALNR